MKSQIQLVAAVCMTLSLAGCPLEAPPQARNEGNDAQAAEHDAARPEPGEHDAGEDETDGGDGDASALPGPDAQAEDAARPDARPPEPGARCLNDPCTRRLTREALILQAPDGALTHLVGHWRERAGALHVDQLTIPTEAASLRFAPAALVYSIEDDTLSGSLTLQPPEGFGGAPTPLRVALAVGGEGHAWADDAPFKQRERLYLALTFEADGAALGHGLEVAFGAGTHALLDGASGRTLFEAVNVTLPGLGQQHAAPFSVAPGGATPPASTHNPPDAPPHVHLGFAGTARLPGPVFADGWIYIADPGGPEQRILTQGALALTHSASELRLQLPDASAVSDGQDTALAGAGPPWVQTPLAQQLTGRDDGLVTGHSGDSGFELLYDGALVLGALPLADATLRFDPAAIELDAQVEVSLTLGPLTARWALDVRGPVDPEGAARLTGLNVPALALGPFQARQPVLAHGPEGTLLLAALELPDVDGTLNLRAPYQAGVWLGEATGTWRLAGIEVNAVRLSGEAALVATGLAQIEGVDFPLRGTLLDGRPTLSGTGQLQLGVVLLDPLTVQLSPEAGALSGSGEVPSYGPVLFTATLMGAQPLIWTGTGDLNVLRGRVSPGVFSFQDVLRYAGTARVAGTPPVHVEGAWNGGFYELIGPLQLQIGGFTLADARLALTPQVSDILGTLVLPAPILAQVPLRGPAGNATSLNGSPPNGRLTLAGHLLTQSTVQLTQQGATLNGVRTLQGRPAALRGPLQPNGQYLLSGAVANLTLAGFALRNAVLQLQPAGATLSATAVLIAEFAMQGPVRADGSIQLNGQRRTADLQASARSCVGNVCVTLRSCTLRDGVASLELRDQAWSAQYRATCCAAGLPCFGVSAAISLQGRSCINLGVGNVCLQVL